MSNTAIEFLLYNLGQLATHHYKLIAGADGEVKSLTNDLNYFKALLKYASKRKIEDPRQLEFVRQVRETVYNAEDVVDKFLTQTFAKKTTKWYKGFFTSTIKLDQIAQEVQTVRGQVEGAFGDKSKLDFLLSKIGDDGPDQHEVRAPRQENVVGFEDSAQEIIGCLNQETDRLDIISIIGMPGLGKSTLAGKILQDPKIQYEFPIRLWVYVSRFAPKDVFISMLREFTSVTDDMHKMTAEELAPKVKAYLDRGKFLIVMDDVWNSEDWKKVMAALPSSNNLGKILITSRSKDVATFANPLRPPYKLRFLTKDESWELLKYEVFGKPNCHPDLEVPGKIISDECEGLPLTIVVIGGILRKKVNGTQVTPAMINDWEHVSKRVNEYAVKDDPENKMDKVISLSYDILPYDLKLCFLYFAMFPEDIEIPAWKLFRMWIAEGFVEEKKDSNLEENAESYLDELINMNLVRVDKRTPYGKVKSCRIHDSLRDFCKKKAGHDGMLEEIKELNGEGLKPAIIKDDKYRRLCIHSDISKFLSTKPSALKVRSLVCFSKDEVTLDGENVSTIPAGFKMLRVLDLKPIKFKRLTVEMFDLLHLRHIHLSFELDKLPKAFSKLWNLQTLIVDTTHRTLNIEADIWKMCHLEHLKTNAIATLPPTEGSADGENKIRTLGAISAENCTDKVFVRSINLRRVSIRGPLDKLLKGEIANCSFKSMMKLEKLEKIKLKNDAFPQAASEGKLPYLPDKFHHNIKFLTLSATYLQWNQIKNLASHTNLEVLKLKENAFTGNYWENNAVFENLKILFIDRTDLVIWRVSAHHFPKLMHLELHNCEKLREVPIEFANIQSLKVMVLHYCGTAAFSAKNILAAKINLAGSVNKNEFKLSTLPPI